MESRGVGATFAFGFEKKYVFSKKLEHKTFCVSFFISRFWGNFFFQKKSQNFDFSKSRTFPKMWKFFKTEKISTPKKIFFRHFMFFEKHVS